MCRPGGKLCVGCRVVWLGALTGWDACAIGPEWCAYGAKADTQFATWAAVDCLARRAVTRVYEAGEAHGESVGNEREQLRCHVKCGDVGGPWANVKNWRCEPLSFAYFSLRRQRKVGAAPHRGDA